MLETHDEVIRIAHDDDIAGRSRLSPSISPQVEHVVQVDVGQQRANASALYRTFLTARQLPVLQHTGPEPFLDQAHDAPVRHAMLDKLHQPFVIQRVEESANVCVEYPAHPRRDRERQCIQRNVMTATMAEPVRATYEDPLVVGTER